jgi:protein SCO1
MFSRTALLLCFSLILTSCAKRSDERRYPVHGKITSIERPRKLVILNHDEIKGFMPAMTMPYDVRDVKVLDGLEPGDIVDTTLIILSNGAYLTDFKKVGHEALTPPPAAPSAPSASSGFELLNPGDAVPDAPFVDQSGKKRRFADFKGTPLAVTFIYTKCPLPTFCPLMDRHFKSMQKPLAEDPALKSAHLVTISFDPVTDTPPVLRAHARTLGADLTRWTFLTGDRDDIDKFASRFGVAVSRALNDPRDITHNLRTAIVDRDGKLVKVYTGNEWSPEELLTELRKLS